MNMKKHGHWKKFNHNENPFPSTTTSAITTTNSPSEDHSSDISESGFCNIKTGLPLKQFEDQFKDCVLSAHPQYTPNPKYINNYPKLPRNGMCAPLARIALTCEDDHHHGPGSPEKA